MLRIMWGATRLLLILALAAGPAFANDAALWFQAGRPTPAAMQVVQVLSSAADQGLEPDDYQADALSRELAQAAQAAPAGQAQQAALDAALTAALQRYLHDLQNGRVDPALIHAEFDVPRRASADIDALVREAAGGAGLPGLLAQAQPQVPMYAALRQALDRYQALGDHPAWQQPLPRLPGRTLVAGRRWAGLPQLASRLQALGDLAAGSAVPSRFEGAVVAALRAFQERHGLAPDGVLGRATLQQLEVPPRARALQIRLAMERLRWTPLLQAPRMIVVNVPEFVLRAYEVADGRVDVKLTMRVVVGKAMDTRTPLFDEDMRFIEFNPYWNVPFSIARQEIVPRLRRDPGYFEREGFEFVTNAGQVVTTLDGSHLDAVMRGAWRIRQRPGPRNALGDIKFVFPNRQNIYLHHTPALRLFERDRRDFSHGCIRVQDPVGLAQFVLQDEDGWTGQRIRDAMSAGESSTLRLSQPLPVLIAYSTVIVRGGRVFFYPDLYGHDRVLEQALRQRSAAILLDSSPPAAK